MKHLKFLIVFLLLALIVPGTAFAEDGTGASVARPYINDEDRTMVPLRLVSEKLGYSVEWNREKRTATIVKDDISVEVYAGESRAVINGEKVQLDSGATIKEGRLFVPIRFVSEQFGWDVNFHKNNGRRVIYLTRGDLEKRIVFEGKVISRGDETYRYTEKMQMEATAYTYTGNNTATGIPPRKGIVAVDPELIPMGTRLYVENYGYCVAMDQGGSIEGKRIDLFMETAARAHQWGRRQVDVYVLR